MKIKLLINQGVKIQWITALRGQNALNEDFTVVRCRAPLRKPLLSQTALKRCKYASDINVSGASG